ncbi:MAG TPA: homoserine dehydrogenase [Tepidisphaeraceae bacterium]|nr:homoserine dehydrogenase [Tepidisphaeraceae bacterium]
MADKTIGICLLGCGIVGGGVERILREQRELLKQRTGIDFELRHVVVKDRNDFPPNHAELPMSTDANAAIDDPGSDIIVELIGGTGVAGTFIERALKLGKPVVTANKSLLALKGPDLFKIARQYNACIAFEASCGGGIPIIEALLHGLVANKVHALVGIVNGTCNFILSQMTQKGWSYQEALAEAQKQGFAEANPALDVSGRDPAQKLSILAGLAFNVRIAEADIHVEGIDKLQVPDIGYARELGYVIKLLAIAERAGDGQVALRVHPTLVHADDMLAKVSGSFNAISVYGHALGHSLYYGRGAGRTPTASAIVADLVGVAMGTAGETFKRLHIYPDQTPAVTALPFEQLQSRYYIRLAAKDEPGVLAKVTAALGKHGISVAAVLQRESNGGQFVPVVITTHSAREGSMREALKEIDGFHPIQPPTVCLRIIDQPEEFGGN